MKKKTANYFAQELQSILDQLMKDFVYDGGKKYLRALVPKEWRGRAKAFDEYVKRTNKKYDFKVDAYDPSFQYSVRFDSFENEFLYFVTNIDNPNHFSKEKFGIDFI
jgi:hypothetical protein